MRVFALELKRVLKTRMTWLLLAAALGLTVWFAWVPTTFHGFHITEENGQETVYRGMAYIQKKKELQTPIAGVLTPDVIQKAVEQAQGCLRDSQVESEYDLRDEPYVYVYGYLPVSPVIPKVKEAYADFKSGAASELRDIDPAAVEQFYPQCQRQLEALMQREQPKHPEAGVLAEKLYDRVEKPFTFYPGFPSDAIDYQVMLALLIMVICIVITAPVFSSDYQTGADDILRCTRQGRLPLGLAKAGAALLICGMTFGLCAGLYILISNSLFGWETTKTSVQMLYSAMSLTPMNVGQLKISGALVGLLCLLNTVAFTLFLSANIKNPMVSMAVSLTAGISPMFLCAMSSHNLMKWLVCLLPAQGLNIQSNFIYELVSFDFLCLGKHAFWMPHVTILFALLELPLFVFLAVHSYCRHSK